jgi:uncharacterized protein
MLSLQAQATMAVDHIRYDLLVQEALRGLVRTVLGDAAKNGVPGEHHFYVTFDTGADGVRLSPRMRAQYAEEMTVVLQHQFWDLVVNEDGFEVGLSFGGIPERVAVPFSAIKGFFDPSVQFGLQFEEIGEAAAEARGEKQQGAGVRPPAEHRGAPSPLVAAPTPANPDLERKAPDEPEKPASGEVVRLDRFRKK